MDQGRQLWESDGFESYKMDFQWHCFCHPTYTSPVVVAVEPGGLIGSVVYADGGLPVDQTAFGGFRTVEGLFELVQDALDRKPHSISVQYHPDMGYPLLVAIDFVENVADDENGFEVFAISAISGEAATSFESWAGLLDLEEVRKTAGRTDVEIGEPNVNSGVTAPNGVGIEAMCVYEFVTPEISAGGTVNAGASGPSMTLTAILFDSEESADAHYQTGLDSVKQMKDAMSPEAVITEGISGDASYLLTVDAEGVGSIFGTQVGPYILSLHTTLAEGQDLLVAPKDLVALTGSAQVNLVIALKSHGGWNTSEYPISFDLAVHWHSPRVIRTYMLSPPKKKAPGHCLGAFGFLCWTG